MNRLGVVGTMVWDNIHGRGPQSEPVEEWGGIAYALAALEASLPDDWELVPLIKVGKDLAPEANAFLNRLTHRSAADRFVEVPDSNNRVTLLYESSNRRAERLSGGVPPWSWDQLGPMVRDLDAIYLNFISGFEMDLETATYLRQGFQGPIYADLHSLFLGIASDGLRVPRMIPEPDLWMSCFDAVQINEDELALLGPEPMEVAARALAAGVRLLVVTLGPEGAVYFSTPPFDLFARSESPHMGGPIRTTRIPVDRTLEEGDPTGCGDVFGGTLVGQLVHGVELEVAIARANTLARRNLTVRGATNLHYHLRGEIAPT
jgi:hypothetical protein